MFKTKPKNNWEPEDDWFYESNIQNQIKRHLISIGWHIKKESNTKLRNQGADLLAYRDNDLLRIEVKGYPSDKYVRGKNKGKKKKTKPSTQARHWFGEALLSLVLAKCKNPELNIAMGLPVKKTYEKKWNEIEWLRNKINLQIYWVDQNGVVIGIKE